jgi:hypothetical protein
VNVAFRSMLLLILAAVTCSVTAGRSASGAPPLVEFEAQVLPILNRKCAECHGRNKRNSGFSVLTGAELIRGGESGPAIVPGKPDDSLMLQLVHDGQMPPEGHAPLTEDETGLIQRWVAEGAAFKESQSLVAQVTSEQIVPLLLLRCSACHGGRRTEAGLDLRTRDGILRGGKSGPAAVVGKPEESLLIRRIHAEEMPPRRLLVSVSVKPMEATELKLLETWIAAGMPMKDSETTAGEPDLEVTDEDRTFWSFRAPQAVTPPGERLTEVSRSLVRNPVDEFILEALNAQKLSLSPEADRVTLIRRLYFDLIGLPPTPEAVAEFEQDSDPRAFEKLVDQLLLSPHYGERWARHWLDVAGYADSEGSQNEDRIRPDMWRYRDYVIRAFNSDKPYDRFLHEQLAGDELADYQNADVITDEIYDNIAATGFLRTAPDRTFANITNFVPDRLEVIADEVQILGSSVMGLTLHCARCHSHKFDPIPQRDYYRLTAALKDALDEHDWIGPEMRTLSAVTTAERESWRQHEQQIDTELKSLQEQLQATAGDEQKKTIQEQIKQLESRRRPEPKIRALWSRGDPSPTFILRRGNYLTPGPEVLPDVPAALTDGTYRLQVTPPWPGAKTTGRRLALARWLTQPDHPLTARVMVNRIWQHHFGKGIVATTANFGKTGAPPTHPALLDWLAAEFVRSGWSISAMHRLMVNSATYRQSSQVTPELLAADPDNRLLSRMRMRRLEAEAVRDSLLLVAGRLDRRPFGPPDSVNVREDGLVTATGSNDGERRSIYVLHRRTKMPTILESFDSPQMGPNCNERGESIVAPQALHLLNNAVVHQLAAQFAERVIQEAGSDPTAQVIRVHQLASGRSPASEEIEIAHTFLKQAREQWILSLSESASVSASTSTATTESAPATGDSDGLTREAEKKALQNYCHAIMNSAAFVYVD